MEMMIGIIVKLWKEAKRNEILLHIAIPASCRNPSPS